jgi:hypothetical protein
VVVNQSTTEKSVVCNEKAKKTVPLPLEKNEKIECEPIIFIVCFLVTNDFL